MTRRPSIKKALVLAIASLGALAGTIQPAKATLDPPLGALVCDANDPIRPANGPITALGTTEHERLQDGLFIPAHEARCPQTAGAIAFERTSEAFAIDALQKRFIPSSDRWQPTPFIALNQPLSTKEYAEAVSSTYHPGLFIGAGGFILHLPQMIDGFVVTANIPCPAPPGAALKLTPHTLSLVYSGIVVAWNDVALRVDNPWLLGCNAPIVASARTDAAWANAILKDYMSKQNPVFEHYEQRANLASWPPTLPIGCAANSERAMVSCASRRGSIAYVRYATAKAVGLTPVRLTNGDGQTPPPALDPADTWPSGCPAAVPKETTSHTGNLFGPFLDWSTFSMTHGKGYPLCGFGYVVTTITMAPGTTREQYDARTDHYELMWSSTSQEALKGYGYAPLPSPLIEIVRGTVAMQIDFD